METTSHAALDSSGVLDSVLTKYKAATSTWATVIMDHAMRLFITLAAISMVWTFAQLMFHRSSFAEFFGEFIRFLLFTGTFWWFLQNAPKMAEAIISSLMKLGAEASGQGYPSPSGIVDIGFKIFDSVKITLAPASWAAFLIAAVILVILALVGINMLLQLCAAWVLAYAGIFFLGFGGSRWTSDMAINYFKTVLGVGASLMTMTLLVGVGSGIVNEAVGQIQFDPPNLKELGVLLVFSITLLMLVDKLPAMVAGIITGAGIGSMGVGSFGAGAAVGAAMTAAAGVSGAVSMAGSAASMAGSAVSKAASMAGSAVIGAAGAGSALKAAAQTVSDCMPGTPDEDSGSGRSFSSAMGTSVSFAARVGHTLENAAKEMGPEQPAEKPDTFKQRFDKAVANSKGGQMASKIRSNGN